MDENKIRKLHHMGLIFFYLWLLGVVLAALTNPSLAIGLVLGMGLGAPIWGFIGEARKHGYRSPWFNGS